MRLADIRKASYRRNSYWVRGGAEGPRSGVQCTQFASYPEVIKVLVVDDHPDVRLSFGFMLQSLGCQVAEAPGGRDALNHLATHRTDLVLTDLNMPGMDGIVLIETIRQRPVPHPKIIAVSGSSDLGYDNIQEAATSVGADAVLAKPISREQLLLAIRQLMGERRKKPR